MTNLYTAKRSAVRAARNAMVKDSSVTGYVINETEAGWTFSLVTQIRRRSIVAGPCNKVWDIASRMPGARRKDVVQAAVDAGIAFYTARTQYQAWHAAQA